MREASAHGKVILFGEYAVLSGVTGYAVALKDFKLTVQLPQVHDNGNLDVLLQNAIIRSNIPQGSGLGSSAALSVALARCIIESSADDEVIFNVAKRFDDQFHDGSSGIDVYTSLHGGLIKSHNGQFQKLSDDFLQRLRKFKFSIIDTKVQRKVKEIKRIIDKEYYDEFIREASKISNTFTEKLINDTLQLSDMIKLFDNYQIILKNLNVSNELIDKTIAKISTSSLNGQVGVKITGGGGGGCLLLVHDENVSESLILKVLCDSKLKLYHDIKI